MSDTARAPTPPVGARIRERRLRLGLKQGALAEAVGISGSYLNLIEHNRRRIGGKVLADLARALQVDPATLTDGAGPGLAEGLRAAAAGVAGGTGPEPELDDIDELASRFPGWSGVVAAQRRRIEALEAALASLRDRLAHDPVLSEAMHGVLSGVTAIRSTAEILVEDPDLAPNWRTRFHRNLNEEAERLSETATAMLRHFESQDRHDPAALAPQEAVEAFFDRRAHFFAEIEMQGAAAIEGLLAGMPEVARPVRDMARWRLAAYAEDALRLPLEVVWPAAVEAGFEPGALLGLAGGDAALVLRRLATLPDTPDGLAALGAALARAGLPPPEPGQVPGFGLAICDGAGATLFRRRLPELAVPFHAAGCPLWPIYQGLTRPGVPQAAILELPEGVRLAAWSVGTARPGGGFGGPVLGEAVMLFRAIPAGEPAVAALPVGTTCRVCPRTGCAARREPRLL